MFFPASAPLLRSAAAFLSAPRAARLDPPGTHPGAGGRSPHQHRRAVRVTVREERDGAAGDKEPATKSRASVSHQPKRKIRETVRSSVDRQHYPSDR
jgi:hypothetical protein